MKIDLKHFLSEFDFIVASDSKVTLFLGVAVRGFECEMKSNLPFGCLRSSVGNIAIVQNRKEHKWEDVSILFHKELC